MQLTLVWVNALFKKLKLVVVFDGFSVHFSFGAYGNLRSSGIERRSELEVLTDLDACLFELEAVASLVDCVASL